MNWTNYVAPIALSISTLGIVFGGIIWIVKLIIKAELSEFKLEYTKDFNLFKVEVMEAIREGKN